MTVSYQFYRENERKNEEKNISVAIYYKPLY